MIDFSLHPVKFLRILAEMHDMGLTFSFSRYFYRKRSPIDERESFQVLSENVTEGWLSEQLDGLQEGWELALNSLVKDSRGRTFHIPMIDFVGNALSFFVDGRCREIVGQKVYDEMLVYNSGRSLHGYSFHLLSPGDWVTYMGRLLLIDFPGEPELIDHRWIGHRLLSGYAALRWSANSELYLGYPERIDLAKKLSIEKKGVGFGNFWGKGGGGN